MELKKISTSVNSGDIININNSYWIIGEYKKGLIKISKKINETSCITDFISVKKLNKIISNEKAL